MMLKRENNAESYSIGFHESRKKFAYGVLEVSKASRDSESVGNGFTSCVKPSLLLCQRYNHVRRWLSVVSHDDMYYVK